MVRAGLTGKHVDVPELLKLLDPAVAVPVLSPRVLADGVSRFDTPAPEFRLYLVELAGHTITLPGDGPADPAVHRRRRACCERRPGQAARARPAANPVSSPPPTARLAARGPARLFLAAPGATVKQS